MHLFQGAIAAVFLSSCSRAPKPYTDVGTVENLRAPLMDSIRSGSGSLQQNGRGQSVPIDRSSGMNSLIVYNSYSNRAGAWSRASYSGRYSHSYGSIENKRYLEFATWSRSITFIRNSNNHMSRILLLRSSFTLWPSFKQSQFPRRMIQLKKREKYFGDILFSESIYRPKINVLLLIFWF